MICELVKTMEIGKAIERWIDVELLYSLIQMLQKSSAKWVKIAAEIGNDQSLGHYVVCSSRHL